MDTETFAGTAALGASILLTCVGLPSQIIKTFRTKSASGLSVPMMTISFLTYIAWGVYGAVKTPWDTFLIFANVPGAIFSGIVLLLIAKYRSGSADS